MGEVVDLTSLRAPAPGLKGGGGDGTSGGMETRIAVLESDVSHLKADVAELRADVREMKADISTIKTDIAVLKVRSATKEFLVAVVVGTAAVFSALNVLAPAIRHLLGLQS